MYTQYFFNFIVLLIVFINLFSIPTTVTSDPRATAASNVICGSGKPTTTSYKSTFVQAMEQLSSNLNNSNSNFATINITNIPSSDNTTTFSFYALFHCHEDLSRTDCLVCYAVSRTAIPACLPRTSGRIFLDGCYVRYDNRSFFQEAVDPDTDTKNCSSNLRSDDWRDFRGGFSEFNQSVRGLVENITNVALNNSGFSAMKYGGVYGLAQCWKSLRNDGCRNCLEKAKNEVKTCMPSRDGRAMNAGCFLRYSTQKFYHTHDEQGNGSNSVNGSKDTARKLMLGFSCGAIAGIFLFLLVKLCQKKRLWETREYANHEVEIFIKNYRTLALKRFNYSEIKRITNSFVEILGKGAFGSVYKGQLPDGKLVAVKLLAETQGDGEDFINEVASIGRTSHVNIVTLLGFCIEGKKRALMYEFMPNGSLDKFLCRDGSHLDCNTLFQIAKGIARGLEYLHRGCNTRIVHFDIKPHNILLDEEFIPKISDFGLAKLCKTKESIVSVMGARGTAGYMAPEVFFKYLGGASHKSDVYSFGMMVLEMTGARKNNKVSATSTSSEAYFPDWVYMQIESGSNLGDNGRVTTEYEEELVKKLMIVGLWCIQSDPSDRPPISKVVEMLEGSIELLQVPPRRFWSSPSRPAQHTSPSATQSSSGEILSRE